MPRAKHLLRLRERLPRWASAASAEWLAWTGDDRQPADQIAAAAYAALLSEQHSGGIIRLS